MVTLPSTRTSWVEPTLHSLWVKHNEWFINLKKLRGKLGPWNSQYHWLSRHTKWKTEGSLRLFTHVRNIQSLLCKTLLRLRTQYKSIWEVEMIDPMKTWWPLIPQKGSGLFLREVFNWSSGMRRDKRLVPESTEFGCAGKTTFREVDKEETKALGIPVRPSKVE